MSSSQSKPVQLGFAEDQESWLLTNRFFPSKIGGKPAWLELQNIPEAKDLLCEYCTEPCVFLCQVYAGSESNANAFHRTIYVFTCRSGKCCQSNQAGNLKVLRSQLRLQNSFYPNKPSDDSVKCEEIPVEVKLCRVCGVRGPLVCGKCKEVSYCGQLHQKLDWKVHKQICGSTNDVESQLSEFLFPEFEIIIEQEENELDSKKESEKEAEKRRLKEYEDMVKNGQAGAMAEISDADLNEFAETKEDKTFGKFKKAIDSYETQVLRYCRSGSPLWISDNAILNPSNVPNCPNCNGKRSFEFQVMPQMLNELKNYELDWGIIAIYTCEKDCEVNGKYVEEFCYKQDIVKGDDEDNEIDIEKLRLSSNMNTNGKQSEDEPKEKLKPSVKTTKQLKEPSKKSKPEVVSKKAFQENDEWE